MATASELAQGGLRPPITNSLLRTEGVVLLEDLAWRVAGPDTYTDFVSYVTEIGLAMDDRPRQDRTTDAPLGVYGEDFSQATTDNLSSGLYAPAGQRMRRKRASLSVAVSDEACDIDKKHFPGVVPPSTRVVVSEQYHKWIVRNAEDLALSTDATARKKNRANPNIEEVNGIAGRAIAHAMVEKKTVLEALDVELLGQRAVLFRLENYASDGSENRRRVRDLESDRLIGNQLIQEAARLACLGLGYGTTRTNSTRRSLASNMYRVQNPGDAWFALSRWAGHYNDAVRGKVRQSLKGVMRQLDIYEPLLPVEQRTKR